MSMSFVPENRRSPRHAVGVSVRLRLDGRYTAGMLAEIVDMSAGGMRIRAPGLMLSPDSQLIMRVARQDGHAATTVARIVRADQHGIAFRFEDPITADRELLAMPGFWSAAELIDLS